MCGHRCRACPYVHPLRTAHQGCVVGLAQIESSPGGDQRQRATLPRSSGPFSESRLATQGVKLTLLERSSEWQHCYTRAHVSSKHFMVVDPRRSCPATKTGVGM
jgi:hypothetical protein